jgi:hypothetical protein
MEVVLGPGGGAVRPEHGERRAAHDHEVAVRPSRARRSRVTGGERSCCTPPAARRTCCRRHSASRSPASSCAPTTGNTPTRSRRPARAPIDPRRGIVAASMPRNPDGSPLSAAEIERASASSASATSSCSAGRRRTLGLAPDLRLQRDALRRPHHVEQRHRADRHRRGAGRPTGRTLPTRLRSTGAASSRRRTSTRATPATRTCCAPARRSRTARRSSSRSSSTASTSAAGRASRTAWTTSARCRRRRARSTARARTTTRSMSGALHPVDDAADAALRPRARRPRGRPLAPAGHGVLAARGARLQAGGGPELPRHVQPRVLDAVLAEPVPRHRRRLAERRARRHGLPTARVRPRRGRHPLPDRAGQLYGMRSPSAGRPCCRARPGTTRLDRQPGHLYRLQIENFLRVAGAAGAQIAALLRSLQADPRCRPRSSR